MIGKKCIKARDKAILTKIAVSFHPTVKLDLCTEFDEEIDAIFTCSKSVHTVDASTFGCLNANAI